jgi:hypothetical protein
MWVPLDTQPAGTPASIQVGQLPGGTTSSLILVMHGFYQETKVAPDGRVYQKLTVPGLGSYGQTGATDLPAVQTTFALPYGVAGMLVVQSAVMESRTFSGMNVWPKTIPEKDDTTGTRSNSCATKRSTAAHPLAVHRRGSVLAGVAKAREHHGCQGRDLSVPLTPLTGQLDVSSQMQVTFDNDGVGIASPEITQNRAKVASHLFPNWDVTNQFYPPNLRHYDGQYLIILPNGWQPSVQALIDQKSARGFFVTLRFVPMTGNTCDGIRTLIRNWYNATPAEQDHYCLLVGEPDVIPLCAAPIAGNPPTDDLYASMDGDDLDEEVYLGRLSAGSPVQIEREVDKIVAYMDNPPITDAFKTALLVAHQEGAPGKYVGAHESVYNASYAHKPTFTRIYGTDLLARNSLVTYTINQGVGLVAYRGHGSSNSWAGWDGFESYSVNDVAGLLNGFVTPVVWNIACSNHDLGFGECMGEWWLNRYPGGAVASYGATVASVTDQNHELDRQLFKAVYDLGLTTHAQAIQYAEAQMASLSGSENAWFYQLLGDPEMPIRRDRPLPPWAIVPPPEMNPCVSCSLPISVNDMAGQPVPNLQVSLWKPPTPPMSGPQLNAADEVFDNTYTDPAGNASFTVSPTTPGWLSSPSGPGRQHDARLDPSHGADGRGPSRHGRAALRGAATIAGGTTFGFGAPLGTRRIGCVGGRTVRRLEAKAGDTAVRWAGDDGSGRAVPPGLYLATLDGGAIHAVTRVIVVR